MIRYYPLVLTIKQYSKHRWNQVFFSISFLTWKQQDFPGRKWYYRDGFNNALPWRNNYQRLQFSLLYEALGANPFVHIITCIRHRWNSKRFLTLPLFNGRISVFYREFIKTFNGGQQHFFWLHTLVQDFILPFYFLKCNTIMLSQNFVLCFTLTPRNWLSQSYQIFLFPSTLN